jgi:hypothetical protein
MSMFNKFDQVAYFPHHAEWDIDHPDVEYGFITSVIDDKGSAFVRYWRKGEEGKALRTTSCSELTSLDRLMKVESATKGEVERAWKGVKDE